jgi:precorrin-4/cobalt-precorrin-4 C11-methyltransferase
MVFSLRTETSFIYDLCGKNQESTGLPWNTETDMPSRKRDKKPFGGGTVYFIGAGPGDPKFLTLEGKKSLAGCKTVYAIDPYPETYGSLLRGKDVRDPFERVFAEITDEVQRGLREGDVGFLVPGDLTVFSPFLPLVENFGERARVIAGVGILNAAAALLKRTLDMPGVSHAVVLTSPKHIYRAGVPGELATLADAAGTMVLYMNNCPLSQLEDELATGFEPFTPVAIVSRVGMDGEKVYHATLSTMEKVVGDDDIFGFISGDPSLALILVGDILQTRSDPAFWDKRKKDCWDRKRRKGLGSPDQ